MNQRSRYAIRSRLTTKFRQRYMRNILISKGTRHTCVYSQRAVNIVHMQIEFRKPHNANIDVENKGKKIMKREEKKKKKKKRPRGRQFYGINPCIPCNILPVYAERLKQRKSSNKNKKALLVVQIIHQRWFMSARLKSVGDRIGGRRIEISDQRWLMSKRTRTLESSKVEGY